jgi:hypothetical protein
LPFVGANLPKAQNIVMNGKMEVSETFGVLLVSIVLPTFYYDREQREDTA